MRAEARIRSARHFLERLVDGLCESLGCVTTSALIALSTGT
jgi:hypothetical protein